jgi:predicted nuclease of predicted toxin-antitoxin system
VRVLLDENLPGDLVRALPGHDVATVYGLGWSGVQNGELLLRTAERFEAFITMDSNLEFQQCLVGRPFGVIVIHARSNRVADLLPLAELVLAALSGIQPGAVRHVGR